MREAIPQSGGPEPDGTATVAAGVSGLAGHLRVLSDETRLRILLALAEGERGVTAMWVALGTAQPTVRNRLALLRR